MKTRDLANRIDAGILDEAKRQFLGTRNRLSKNFRMAWCYEIRGLDNRLVQLHSGFSTESEAQAAGQRTKRMIDCMCFPNLEALTIVTKKWPDSQRTAPPNLKLKYPWQRLVFDAFMEPSSENVPGKINVAERAISARLLDSAPVEPDEHIALGEALLALRRLIRETEREKESREKEEIA